MVHDRVYACRHKKRPAASKAAFNAAGACAGPHHTLCNIPGLCPHKHFGPNNAKLSILDMRAPDLWVRPVPLLMCVAMPCMMHVATLSTRTSHICSVVRLAGAAPHHAPPHALPAHRERTRALLLHLAPHHADVRLGQAVRALLQPLLLLLMHAAASRAGIQLYAIYCVLRRGLRSSCGCVWGQKHEQAALRTEPAGPG